MPTYEEVREAMVRLSEAVDQKAAMAVLRRFGLCDALSKLSESRFQSVIDACDREARKAHVPELDWEQIAKFRAAGGNANVAPRVATVLASIRRLAYARSAKDGAKRDAIMTA